MAHIALANNTEKLKHWSQAIRDLENDFLTLKANTVPLNHACTKDTYGLGSELYYGHVKLLDNLLYKFKTTDNNHWQIALPKTNTNVDLTDGKWNDIAYHDGLFVAVGSHGRIVTSKDGLEWNTVQFIKDDYVDDDLNGEIREYSSNPNFALYAVEWCGNCFVAVGSHNVFTYSFDGTYWYAPLFVGRSTHGGIDVPTTSDLTIDNFLDEDIWYDVAYDSLTGIIHLCGTQGRTMRCAYKMGALNNAFVFSECNYEIEATESDNYNYVINLYSIAVKSDGAKSTVVACGDRNYVLSATCTKSTDKDNFAWTNKMQVQDSGGVINTLSENTPADNSLSISWKKVSIQKKNDKEMFLLLGSNGKSVYSYTGGIEVNGWVVPNYNSNLDNFEINTIVSHQNLSVVAGEHSENTPGTDGDINNIVMYDENTTPVTETETGLQTDVEAAIEAANTEQSSMPEIKHISEQYLGLDWYGSCFGKDKFFLVGEKNTIIYCDVAEDEENYAISLEFYKKYIKVLEERLLELEGRILQSNLVYHRLIGQPYVYGEEDSGTDTYDENAIANISYNLDNNTVLYYTSGKIKLNFLPAPSSVYREMIIYLEALDDTKLTLNEGAEWGDDLYMPDWGKKGYHLTLKAIFVGNRVVIQIIDNDQLADNLLED